MTREEARARRERWRVAQQREELRRTTPSERARQLAALMDRRGERGTLAAMDERREMETLRVRERWSLLREHWLRHG